MEKLFLNTKLILQLLLKKDPYMHVCDWYVLYRIATEGPMRIVDIYKEAGKTKSAATQIAVRLEDQGYCKKVKDENDTRVVYLEIRKKGR